MVPVLLSLMHSATTRFFLCSTVTIFYSHNYSCINNNKKKLNNQHVSETIQTKKGEKKDTNP